VVRFTGILILVLGIAAGALALAHGSGIAGSGLIWISVWAVAITLIIAGMLVIVWSFDRAR
jgi:hypothetical protein